MRQGTGKWYRIANRSPQNMRLDMQMLYECYHFIETLMLCCLLKLTFLNFLVELAFWKQCSREETYAYWVKLVENPCRTQSVSFTVSMTT